MFPITEQFITGHNRPYRKLDGLKAIIIHWTANTNRGANAMANRNYFNSKHYDTNGNIIYASAHYIID
jgi:N-acetylmuramoyl-L-alanine amidase CwlA